LATRLVKWLEVYLIVDKGANSRACCTENLGI